MKFSCFQAAHLSGRSGSVALYILRQSSSPLIDRTIAGQQAGILQKKFFTKVALTKADIQSTMKTDCLQSLIVFSDVP